MRGSLGESFLDFQLETGTTLSRGNKLVELEGLNLSTFFR